MTFCSITLSYVHGMCDWRREPAQRRKHILPRHLNAPQSRHREPEVLGFFGPESLHSRKDTDCWSMCATSNTWPEGDVSKSLAVLSMIRDGVTRKIVMSRRIPLRRHPARVNPRNAHGPLSRLHRDNQSCATSCSSRQEELYCTFAKLQPCKHNFKFITVKPFPRGA